MSIVQSQGTSTPSSVIASASNWYTAVSDLISFFVANDRPFSSGEVTAYLRTFCPDLKFSATLVGDYIRERYDDGTFPAYGGTIYPTQVPRTTTGTGHTLDGRTVRSKTSPGQVVFVYAPDGASGFAHDFEVYIPDYDDPRATRAVPIAAPATPAPQIPTQATGVLITGALLRADLEAVVRSDRRLCVPRAAFEAFVALTGQPLRGGPQGDPVHVTFRDRVTPRVEITRDPVAGSQPFHLWVTRGRLALHAAPGFGPFEPGDKYPIMVSSDKLVIQLT